MKLIIDIDEEDRADIANIHFVREDLKFKIGEAIMNGTPFVTGISTGDESIPEYKTWNYDNETCKYCGNNPKNGGSGVCHCKLATYKIT